MRLDGWEERLFALIEEARTRTYKLGDHDCFSFACSAVNVLTGVDRWNEYAGKYSTRDEAMALISAHAESFNSAFDLFGFPRVDWKVARRGDLISFKSRDGERHLGVCTGNLFVGLGPEGLRFLPMHLASCAWRVD